MKPRIIAIEGICCSGKSTLVTSLNTQREFGIIAEYGKYSHFFPKLATNFSELQKNTHFFIQLERQRYNDGYRVFNQGKALFLDRSFITCCAFDYAAFNKSKLSCHIPTLETMWKTEQRKLVPNIVVVLQVDEENFQKRLASSGKTLTPLLRNPYFNQRFYKYLNTIEIRWGYKLVWVNTNNLTKAQVKSIVLETL